MRTRVSGPRLDNASGRFDPVKYRHADVHEHDIRSQPVGLAHGVFAVGGFTDDGGVRLAVEDLAEAYRTSA